MIHEEHIENRVKYLKIIGGESMKRVKKLVVSLIIIIIILTVSVPIINNYYAYRIEMQLYETPLPEKTEIIDSTSKAGKLVGNGNGMQYFGAILIKSKLSLENLRDYYSDFKKNEWSYIVEQQEGPSINLIEHGTISFSKAVEGENYYIVYSWGTGNSLLEGIDFRGH